MILRRLGLFALLMTLGLAVSACDDTPEPGLTTTSSLLTGGTQPVAGATTTTSPELTSTTLRGEQVGDFEVVERVAEDAGEVLYFVIPPGAYTDVDLENFLLGLIDSGLVSYGAEIFDDQDAAAAHQVAESQRTEAQDALIEEHHLISLETFDTVIFRGPFADSGQFVIGS